MGTSLYFEPFNGASGDMIVGALLDLGMPLDHLRQEISRLGIDRELDLKAQPVERQGLKATDFQVLLKDDSSSQASSKGPHQGHSHLRSEGLGRHHSHHQDGSRNLSQIEELVEASSLDSKIKATALLIFRRLGEAEAKVHGTPLEEVHFHEVGAIDSIVDIVGSAIGFAYFEIEEFYTAPLALGGGTVHFSHGSWPVPAPATLELIKGVPVSPGPVDAELLTPTGAAIITSVAASGRAPTFLPRRWGFGSGTNVFDSIPNLLRVTLGESVFAPEASGDGPTLESVSMLEATLDNMDGEILGYFIDRALSEGALDVYYSALQMKKNRPGVLLTLLCRTEDEERFSHLIFSETTTLGLRRSRRDRLVLARGDRTIDTVYGPVRVKIGKMGRRIVNMWPEYEDLKALSEKKGVPLKMLRLAVARQLNLDE